MANHFNSKDYRKRVWEIGQEIFPRKAMYLFTHIDSHLLTPPGCSNTHVTQLIIQDCATRRRLGKHEKHNSLQSFTFFLIPDRWKAAKDFQIHTLSVVAFLRYV